MAAKKLEGVSKMSMKSCCPSHSGSSDTSLHAINRSHTTSLEVTAIDLRFLVIMVVIDEICRQMHRWET